MEIIPVLDIQHGIAVSGESGERDKYKPLKTVYSSSSNPLLIVMALPYQKLYVADLDGIMHGTPDYKLLKRLCQKKKTLIDAGLRSYDDVQRLSKLSCELILGTETIGSINDLRKAIKNYGERLWISLDIKNDRVLSEFLPDDITEAVKSLVTTGVRNLILLNISGIGTLRGVNHGFLKALIQKYPDTEFIVGGGIRKEDLSKLEKIGVKAVLVGTALHRGLLS